MPTFYTLQVPQNTQAILWDLDGTLIDSLTLDCEICTKLVRKFVSSQASVSREFIRSIFAYEVPVFWKMILEKLRDEFNLTNALNAYGQILPIYNSARQSEPFPLNPGIQGILDSIKASDSITQAVVSNNPTLDIMELLEHSGIKNYFDIIIGNDIKISGKPLAKKPAPDTFLHAANLMGVVPKNCVVIEDSIIGVQGGKTAGAYVIGVATGSANLPDLEKAGADKTYQSFA